MVRCLGCMELMVEGTICPHCGYEQNTKIKEAYHLVPGSILSERYLVGKVLGYGGFGITYIGYDRELERRVAIKEFLPTMFATRMPGDREVTVYSGELTRQFQNGLIQFQDEAKRLAKFNSLSGIVHIYDNFQDNNTAYIVMELLEGQDIKTILKANIFLPVDTAKDIILSACKTLAIVHREGIIHRDISPDNIFLTNDGDIKLIDFGAARYETSKNSKSLSVILKTGYAPEEQYRSKGNQGSWTDVYALAATFYKMITGLTAPDSMERAVTDELILPSKLGIAISKSDENALLNALAVRAEDRLQSVEEFEKQLLSDHVNRNFVKKREESNGISKKTKVVIGAFITATIILVFLTVNGRFSEEGFLTDTFGTSLIEGTINAPGVLNLSQNEARGIAEKDELNLLVTGKEFSDQIEKDKVLSQNPLPGRAIEIGSNLEVIICGGSKAEAELEEVPDVVFMEEDVAKEIMRKKGLQVFCQYFYNENVKTGLVIEQKSTETGIALTISLGASSKAMPYVNVEEKDSILVINSIYPLQDEEAVETYFLAENIENNKQTIILPVNKDYYNSKSKFSDMNVEQEQILQFDMAIMDLAANQTPGIQEYKITGRTTYYNEEPGDLSLAENIKIISKEDKISITQIEETGEEDGKYKYCVKGDFVKGDVYYLYEGMAVTDGYLVVCAKEDGWIEIVTEEPFDGSRVLARFYPVYELNKSDVGWEMTVGQSTTIDGTSQVLQGDVGNFQGKTVLEAVKEIEKQAGRYAERLPYRFSYVDSETIPRGCIIDYYLEGDSQNGEIYKLDFVISNGSPGERGDMFIPVQWVTETYAEQGEPYYASLRCFVMSGNPEEDNTEKCTYVMVSDDNGDNYYVTHTEADTQYSYLRGNGSNKEVYFEPEGYICFDAYAKELVRQGVIGDKRDLTAKCIPVIRQSDTVLGEEIVFQITTIEELER